MKNVTICLFGSSIMEGRIGLTDSQDRWYNMLQRLLSQAHLDTCFPIINSAVGGESTREIMNRFDRDVLAHNPDICLVMIGANNHDCQNPSRALAEGELQTLMDSFVSRLPEKTKSVGVVLNPVVDAWHFVTHHPAYKNLLAPFGGSLDACMNPERDFARSFYIQHNWPYLDLYALMSDCPANYTMPEDGIHLNKAGHALFAQKMFEIMDPLFLRSE